MANYKVDIGVKVRGDELKKFQTQLDETQKKVNGVNRFLDTFKKQNIRVNESISNLNAQLIQAKTTFDNATLGTKQATQATKDYLTALTNTNAALATQKAAVISLQNAKRSDAFFLAQGAIAGRQNRLDEVASQAQSVAIARKNNIRIQAELKNQQLLEEVKTRAPRLPAFQERGLERLEDEFKKKKELKILEENANKESKRRLNFQERQNQELDRQQKLGIGVKKNEKLINASYADRVKFAEKNGKIRRQALIRANNLVLAEKKITEQRVKQKKAGAVAGQGRRTLGSTASSAIIGGAFPLLFGQTGAAAVGGATGGALGGLIGGQFGFALSILGTAIGSFIQEQDKLDQSLSKISRSFENAGNSTGFTRDAFNDLKRTTGMTKDEVLGLASAFARYGEAGESAAFIFGDNPQTFKNLAAMRDTKTLVTAILDEQNGLSIQQQIQLLREAKITSFKDVQLKLNRMILEENFKREISEARQITRQDKIADILKGQLRTMILMKVPFLDLQKAFPEFFKKAAEKAEEDVAKITAEFEELTTELPKVQELLAELDTQVLGMSYSIPSAIDSVSAELKKLTSVGYMVTTVADSVGSAFGESFKGIVSGSMTAQQALARFFQRTADAFLDMAAQMIAKQIQMRILGIGLNIFGSGGGGGGETDVFAGFNRGATDPNTLTMDSFANGGRPPVGRPSLVGERGPELFVPNSAGTIIPNHAMGGSTNIVVNVDASGTSAEGDQANGEELGRLIGAAVQAELIKERRPGGLLG